MTPSLVQVAIVAVIIILLFGRGKISAVMGDLAKGITSFKKGLTESDDDDKKPVSDVEVSSSEKTEDKKEV